MPVFLFVLGTNHVCMGVYPSGVGMSEDGAPRWRLCGVRIRVRPVMANIDVAGGKPP